MRCKPRASDWANLLLLTLYLSGGRLRGRTRLQKLAFLINQKLKRAGRLPPDLARLACLEFRPAIYGPYSPELAKAALEYAISKNIVSLERPIGKTDTFYLTRRGREVAEALALKLNALGVSLDEIASLADLPLAELVKLVYDAYPEYTIKSRIKGVLESGAVIVWDELEEGDIELLKDMVKEGFIKMRNTIFLDRIVQDREIELYDGKVKITLGIIKARRNSRGIRPVVYVSLYPRGRKEEDNR